MNIMIFDTETTSLNKPFCYNIGYVILDTETQLPLLKRDYVVEQVWHNPMLFSTSYYAEKRPIYVARMRSRSTVMDKFGYICQQMIRDCKQFEVSHAYAYNAPFDEKVFEFNCDWFKCNNPFDNIAIHDILGYACNFITDIGYKLWCEANEQFTENGNYPTSAETVFRYISQNLGFIEEHTALSDSEIEAEILLHCMNYGADITTDYKFKKYIPREVEKVLTIDHNGHKIEIVCNGYTVYKSRDLIKVR